jgi:hypothetical protein
VTQDVTVVGQQVIEIALPSDTHRAPLQPVHPKHAHAVLEHRQLSWVGDPSGVAQRARTAYRVRVVAHDKGRRSSSSRDADRNGETTAGPSLALEESRGYRPDP